MIIRNAERFGLSQLHQLRGRVGRGEHKSYCILFSDNNNKTTKERLELMTKSNDGFKISKKDIELRGPGECYGNKQSGALKFKIANLSSDMDILYKANQAAKTIISQSPDLSDDSFKLLKDTITNIII